MTSFGSILFYSDIRRRTCGRLARPIFEEIHMPAIVDTEKCNACKSCEEVCPTDSIAVPETFAVVKAEDCIDCNACMDACISQAITMGD